MVMYDIYETNVKKKYRAHFCSFATLFILILTGLCIICPLLAAYYSDGLWLLESTYREQGDIHFKHQFVILLRGLTGQSYIAYSTFSNYNVLFDDQIRIPSIRSGEFDTNYDGRNDYLTFTIEIPLKATEVIHNLMLLMFFDYKLHHYSSVQMESMAYLHYDSSLPGAEFVTDGELRLIQKKPLPHRGKHILYNKSIIEGTSLLAEDYDLSKIFSEYKSRNLSTHYQDDYPIWRIDGGETDTFIIRGKINYPEELITFRPGIWQLLKFAWIQYVAVLAIFLFVYNWITHFVIDNQLVETVLVKKSHID